MCVRGERGGEREREREGDTEIESVQLCVMQKCVCERERQ